MASVNLQHIVKTYDGKQAVVQGVDLAVTDAEFIVFVGPSGCGKSTLLRMIAGLETISAGELQIGGRRMNEVDPAKRGIAMVFQSYALYPHMTVAQNMGFALKLAGASKAEQDAAVERAAAILQIAHLLARKPKELSGGQRQRVAIGRAIVRKPEVFLFDEPLSNLDASLRVQMRQELSRLHKELKTTMIYVTHDQVEAMTLGQRIVVFNGGRIEQIGTPQDLYRAPGNLFVAGFLGAPRMNFMPATVLEGAANGMQVKLDGGVHAQLQVDGSAAKPGERVTVGIRAEHLSQAAGPGANVIPSTVSHVEYLGDQSIAYCASAGVPESLAARMEAQAGASVHLALPPAHCMAFNVAGIAFPRTA